MNTTKIPLYIYGLAIIFALAVRGTLLEARISYNTYQTQKQLMAIPNRHATQGPLLRSVPDNKQNRRNLAILKSRKPT